MSGEKTLNRPRYELLDTLRGLTMLSMIAYHGVWDLVYLFGADWGWYSGTGAYIWQQSICWTFILLSGFCWGMGRNPLRRGLTVFCGGLAVTVVTLIFMPDSRIIFGILTFMGSAMLLMIPLDKLLCKVPPWVGLAAAALLFAVTKKINSGQVGLGSWQIQLPGRLYEGYFATYLGFADPGFYSSDYFSLLPWLFLFITGYFLWRLCSPHKEKMFRLLGKGIRPLNFIGRHALVIYMLHQPVVYAVLYLIF